ncbi:MAG TPA: FGGY family carbohydrate kinase [Gaiellaceae bacterium]|nr:FGGY family carbohydrate kinase [Gaiellaceae bacterium]
MATVLALDVGSSSVRAQRFDERGEPLGELRQERYDGRDPDEIVRLSRTVLDGAEPDGTSCFGHSLLPLDRAGKPLTELLGWRDTRAAGAAEWLRRRLANDAVHARTGAYLHPAFWPAKLAWLAECEPELYRRAERFVSFSDYLLDGEETSVSMASGTGLLDLTTSRWDADLLDALGLEEERLPRLGDPPVWIDGVCSNLGAGCVGHERAALMIGTSGALRILYETERPQPRPGLFLYRLDERRVVEGGALSDGGNLHQWLERTLADPGEVADRDPDEHGLTVLPFLGGERSVGWDPDATGAISGLTFETTPAEIRQAALEGVGYRFAAVADLLPEIEQIVATGGALLQDDAWVQILADALARPVIRSTIAEASLRGAAVASLERAGYEAAQPADGEVFHPREERAESYRSARERQQRLYEELRGEH